MRFASPLLVSVLVLTFVAPLAAKGDETCASPYMKKITGQEDYV